MNFSTKSGLDACIIQIIAEPASVIIIIIIIIITCLNRMTISVIKTAINMGPV